MQLPKKTVLPKTRLKIGAAGNKGRLIIVVQILSIISSKRLILQCLLQIAVSHYLTFRLKIGFVCFETFPLFEIICDSEEIWVRSKL